MKVSRFAVKLATTLLLVLSNQAQARLVSVLSYQEMLAKSDLVVIADPVSKTTDTKEEAFFPGILLQEKDGKQSRIIRLASKLYSPYLPFSKETRV